MDLISPCYNTPMLHLMCSALWKTSFRFFHLKSLWWPIELNGFCATAEVNLIMMKTWCYELVVVWSSAALAKCRLWIDLILVKCCVFSCNRWTINPKTMQFSAWYKWTWFKPLKRCQTALTSFSFNRDYHSFCTCASVEMLSFEKNIIVHFMVNHFIYLFSSSRTFSYSITRGNWKLYFELWTLVLDFFFCSVSISSLFGGLTR